MKEGFEMSGRMISLAEYAEKHGLSPVSVRHKCQRGNVPGAIKIGRNWCVPEDAPYEDHRIVTGRYAGEKRKRKK